MSIIRYSQCKRVQENRDLFQGDCEPRWMRLEWENMRRYTEKTDSVSLVIWLLTGGLAWAKSTFESDNYAKDKWRARQFRRYDFFFQNDLYRSGFLELLDYHGHEHVVGLLMYRAQKGMDILENEPWYFDKRKKPMKYQKWLNEICLAVERMNNIGKR